MHTYPPQNPNTTPTTTSNPSFLSLISTLSPAKPKPDVSRPKLRFSHHSPNKNSIPGGGRLIFRSAAGILSMACASQALVAANACAFSAQRLLKKSHRISTHKNADSAFLVRASVDDSDCNVEECAPDKEVGKVSVEWLAGEKTRVIGTYPPQKKGWTGYVEKDTAGQTNIYSVEPAVYVAESAISSGSAGTSADGTEKTATIAASIAFIAIAAASVIVLQVGKTPSQPQALEYSGPTLTYYINKFKPQEVVQASILDQPEVAAPVLTDQSPPTEVTETADEFLF